MIRFLRPLVISAGAAALVILAGCDSAPERHPRGTQQVALWANRATPDVAMEVISAVEFILPPGPSGSAGYSWEIASNDTRVLEQMGPLVRMAPADPLEAPPTTAKFYALKPGRSVLRFVLIRPGEAEATPAAECVVTVRVSD